MEGSKFSILISVVVAAIMLPLLAVAINITVPSAPGSGYFLNSTSTGAYTVVPSSTFYLSSSTGYLGIGTTAPATNLDVNGTATIRTDLNIPYVASSSVATFDANDNLNSLPSPTDTIQRFLSATGNGTTSGNPSWQVIPAMGYQNYYMTASSSDIASNLQLQASPQTALASTTVSSLATGTSSIQYFSTNVGAPNITSIPAGIFQVSFTARESAGSQYVQIYALINEVSSNGTFVKTIETTGYTGNLTTASTSYNVYADMPLPYVMASSTSRIQVQLVGYAYGGGSSPTVKVYYGDGADDSRIVFPSQAVSARTYVPYSGATNNVNLGTYGLTSTGITSTRIYDSGLGSALTLSTSGVLGNYGGSTACASGNAVTTISATGSTTCSPFLTSYTVNAGTGISVSTTTNSATITNTGVTSFNGATGTITANIPTIATTTKGIFDAQPSTSTPDIMFYSETGFTIKRVDCVNSPVAGNTFTFSLIASSSVQSTATTTVMNGFTCNSTSTIQSTTTFNNAVIPAGSIIQVNYSAASTTGAYVDIKY